MDKGKPKPYTPRELSDVLDSYGLAGWTAGRLYATIEQGFAPEVPTDDQVNGAIAKAQGLSYHWNYTTCEWKVQVDGQAESVIYRPTSNLNQAIDAATALRVSVQVGPYNPYPRGGIFYKLFDNRSHDPAHTAADAARAIALHLYRHIQKEA